MLSINYISKFLSENQEDIDVIFLKKLKNFEKNNNINNEIIKKIGNELPESFDILFNKSLKDFYYNNKYFKNKSPIFTFFNSIFVIGDELFNLFNEIEKERVIKDFIKKMDDDLFEKKLYYKFEYTKNRRFNKSDIQMVLKNGFQFKYCDKFNLLKEYLSDYLGINIYIFHKKNDIFDMDNSEIYLSKKYNNNIQKSLLNFFIIKDNDIYKPLLLNQIDNTNSIIKYSLYNDLIDNIWEFFKLEVENKTKIEIHTKVNEIVSEKKCNKYTYNDVKHLKINELKDLCIKINIDLLKKSEKTGKLINKLKDELINDLLNI
jgi:hypothetical protein